MNKFYITTPIYYVNDVPHIGSAYTTLVADVLARAHRQQGEQVRFITGTDEHGTKVAQKAEAAGLRPKDFADSIVLKFKNTWAALGIEPDAFARTTDLKHEYLAGQVMQLLYDKGLIYEGHYAGWYCVSCEEYKDQPSVPSSDEAKKVEPEALLATPNARLEKTLEAPPAARLEKPPIVQQEAPTVLQKAPQAAPLCDIHSKPLEFLQEKNYHFKLSHFQSKLIELIESDELKISPVERQHEVLSFLQGEPLRDIPVTRSKVGWGIPVPFARDQTIYVWFEALLNYLTFSDENVNLAALQRLQTCWPADLQLIGKDILRFHAVIWPAILLALELPLPKEIFAHGFFTINGAKMSKTTGNVISPDEVVQRYGADAARYLIIAAVPFGADGDISIEKMDAVYTSRLANGLGNLLQRTIVLINKFGIRPQVSCSQITAVTGAYLANDINEALTQTFILVDDANRYLADQKPWSMENDALRETVLVHAYESLLRIAQALIPVMPKTAAKVSAQLESLQPEPLFPRLP